MQLCCEMKKISKLLATYIIYYHNFLLIFHGKERGIRDNSESLFWDNTCNFKCFEIIHLNALQ